MPRAFAGLPVVAVVWAVLIAAAPWADAVPAAEPFTRVAAAATYFAGSLVCHQRPDRSFWAHGVRWPVCARCSGLYVSAAFGVLFAWTFGRARLRVPFSAWRTPLLLAAIPTAATLALEWWNPAWSSRLARAIAAVPLGAVVGLLLAASMSFRVTLTRCERMPSSE